MLRQKLNPIIFVLREANSKRHTTSDTNIMAPWRYRDLLSGFGIDHGTYQIFSVQARKQISALLSDPSFSNSEQLRLVEVHMGKE